MSSSRPHGPESGDQTRKLTQVHRAEPRTAPTQMLVDMKHSAPAVQDTLHRLPVGEWVGLDGLMFPEPTGIGVAETVLHDERGRIGRGVQTVILEELADPLSAPTAPVTEKER